MDLQHLTLTFWESGKTAKARAQHTQKSWASQHGYSVRTSRPLKMQIASTSGIQRHHGNSSQNRKDQ